MKCQGLPNVQEVENALQKGYLAAVLRSITKRKRLGLLAVLDAVRFYLALQGWHNPRWAS